jgi:hypothetical protein
MTIKSAPLKMNAWKGNVWETSQQPAMTTTPAQMMTATRTADASIHRMQRPVMMETTVPLETFAWRGYVHRVLPIAMMKITAPSIPALLNRDVFSLPVTWPVPTETLAPSTLVLKGNARCSAVLIVMITTRARMIPANPIRAVQTPITTLPVTMMNFARVRTNVQKDNALGADPQIAMTTTSALLTPAMPRTDVSTRMKLTSAKRPRTVHWSPVTR